MSGYRGVDLDFGEMGRPRDGVELDFGRGSGRGGTSTIVDLILANAKKRKPQKLKPGAPLRHTTPRERRHRDRGNVRWSEKWNQFLRGERNDF